MPRIAYTLGTEPFSHTCDDTQEVAVAIPGIVCGEALLNSLLPVLPDHLPARAPADQAHRLLLYPGISTGSHIFTPARLKSALKLSRDRGSSGVLPQMIMVLPSGDLKRKWLLLVRSIVQPAARICLVSFLKSLGSLLVLICSLSSPA